jgi:hypothetical protein
VVADVVLAVSAASPVALAAEAVFTDPRCVLSSVDAAGRWADGRRGRPCVAAVPPLVVPLVDMLVPLPLPVRRPLARMRQNDVLTM